MNTTIVATTGKIKVVARSGDVGWFVENAPSLKIMDTTLAAATTPVMNIVGIISASRSLSMPRSNLRKVDVPVSSAIFCLSGITIYLCGKKIGKVRQIPLIAALC